MGETIIRPVLPAEYDVAGELVVDAYRTLGDVGDEWYEQELRDVQGRVGTGEVLVAELEGRVVGCVTRAVGQTGLSEVEDPDARRFGCLVCRRNPRSRHR